MGMFRHLALKHVFIKPQAYVHFALDAIKRLQPVPSPDQGVAFTDIARLTAGNKISFFSQTTLAASNDVIKSRSIADMGVAVCTTPIPGLKD